MSTKQGRTSMDFIEVFKSKIPMLRTLLGDSNYSACSNFGTDLLRLSEFAKYSEGVFIGEFFETLFGNYRSLTDRFDVAKEDIEKMQKTIYPMLDFLENNIPITDTDKKADFYNLLVNARYVVTESQLTYFREKKLKTRLPMQMSPSVSIEGFEEP